MIQTPPDIIWTAHEAMACALCWAEFSTPEITGNVSPEAYWVSIKPKARMEFRSAASELMLLAVARRQAVAMPAPSAVSDERKAMIARYLGLKSQRRLNKILREVSHALRSIP